MKISSITDCLLDSKITTKQLPRPIYRRENCGTDMSSFSRTFSPAISASIMDRTHGDEESSSDEELSSDTPSGTSSNSSTDHPRKPDARGSREKEDGRVPTKSREHIDISERNARDHARRQRWLPKNRRRVVQNPKSDGKGHREHTDRSKGSQQDAACKRIWLSKDQQRVVQDPRPKGIGDTNTSPNDDLERRECHPTGGRVKALSNTGRQCKCSQDSSASRSSWSEIAPSLSTERSLKTALGEFAETLRMYYDMDQRYDSK